MYFTLYIHIHTYIQRPKEKNAGLVDKLESIVVSLFVTLLEENRLTAVARSNDPSPANYGQVLIKRQVLFRARGIPPPYWGKLPPPLTPPTTQMSNFFYAAPRKSGFEL